MNYYEVTVSFHRQTDQGLLKKVSEKYIVNALTHTEAEAIVSKYMGETVRGEFLIKRILKSNISNIIGDVDEGYYKCKSYFVSIDSNSGKEKKHIQYDLVLARDVREAYDTADSHYNGNGQLPKVVIESISFTKIVLSIDCDQSESRVYSPVPMKEDDYEDDFGIRI